MSDLSLTFSDENDVDRRTAVRGESFIIGRHSGCDLTIPDGRLSREHLKIERFDDEYFASDLGSSNGSTLNGEPLSNRTPLNDGDVLELGGVAIVVGFENLSASVPAESAGKAEITDVPGPAAPIEANITTAQSDLAPVETSALPTSIFFVAPILGVVVLALVGALIYLLSDTKPPVVASNEFQYSVDDIEPKNKKGNDDSNSPPHANSTDLRTPNPPETNSEPSRTPSGEYSKIETNGAAFLRRIGSNDSRAFLTGDQAKRVSSKVKQFSGSSTLAANIESARKNSSQITSLAKAKNLKPQFLAVAALMKLGPNRGDVSQTASSIADVLDKLGTQIGNELADDTLLMIAAYDQGASGEFQKMRNQLQELANKYPESSRQIRTIWFLREKNQITESEFDRALTFLAIGIITQNPKEFGVNAEALVL